MITEQQLVESGYLRHSPNNLGHQYSDFYYQKRFSDKIGIQYHLEVLHYDLPGVSNPWTVELTINSPYLTLQQHFAEDLAAAEALVREFWTMVGCPYHERYEANGG